MVPVKNYRPRDRSRARDTYTAVCLGDGENPFFTGRGNPARDRERT